MRLFGRTLPRGARPILRLLALGLAAFLAWRSVLVLSRSTLSSPPPTPLFEDAEGGFLSDGEAVYGALGFWELPSRLPEKVRAVAIAVEDRRFERHLGVDPIGIARAALHSLRGKLEGGSTIAMQVVRMGWPRKRSIGAKIEEAGSALVSTILHGRERVLAHYLKVLPQGGNMYGIAYSARRYFRKPVEDLSWAEAALLFAVPQDPRGRALFDFAGFFAARDRALNILVQLRDQGLIDEETRQSSRAELLGIPPLYRDARPENSYHYVLRLLEESRSAGTSSQGKTLRSGLDPEIQGLLTRLGRGAVDRYRKLGANNLAIMVAELDDGSVRGYLGSAAYFDAENKGSIDYCRVPRSSGSSLKPFFYALGLETGAFGPGSVLADLPLRLKDAGGEYSLTDFDDAYLGPMLYREALGNSRNIPAIRVVEGVGLQECWQALGRLGLHDYERSAEFYGYGLTVGGIYTSLDRLVAAYGSLGSDGKAFPLRWLADAPVEPRENLLSEQSARMVSLFLSDPTARLPSFAGTALTHFPFPVAVKTGSSNGFRDAWALGYSRRYVAGVWIGHSDNLEMNHVAGSTAASLLLELFTALQPEAARGVGEELFPPPRGWSSARICPDSGHLAGEACPRVVLERFAPGAEPRTACEVHSSLLVDRATGLAALPSTPKERLAARSVTRLGPEFASYSLARGFLDAASIAAADPAALAAASIALQSPVNGSRVLVDPELPRRFQTLALRARVEPPVPEIVWYVDGREFARSAFPYEARWPISPGVHRIEARFPRATVQSKPATVTVIGPAEGESGG